MSGRFSGWSVILKEKERRDEKEEKRVEKEKKVKIVTPLNIQPR